MIPPLFSSLVLVPASVDDEQPHRTKPVLGPRDCTVSHEQQSRYTHGTCLTHNRYVTDMHGGSNGICDL